MSGPGIDTPAGYTGTHRIGSGGGATVYRAWDEHGTRWVALKLFHRYVRDQASATAFHEACRAVGRLGAHPAIVAVHAVGVTPTGRAWQAMRLGEGGTLGEALLRTGPVDQAWALAAGTRLADALTYAHGLGVPHGAVRLSNVLLDLESRPLLADFGVGTISGIEWASPSGDVAGLGGVLFALLTGAMPQAGFGVRAGLATPGVQAVPGLPGVLGAVLGVPSEAPVRSAREFGERLREVQAAAGFAVSAADPGVPSVTPSVLPSVAPSVVPEARRAVDSAGLTVTALEVSGSSSTAAVDPLPEIDVPDERTAAGGLRPKAERGLGFGLGRQRRRVLGGGFGRWGGGGSDTSGSPAADVVPAGRVASPVADIADSPAAVADDADAVAAEGAEASETIAGSSGSRRAGGPADSEDEVTGSGAAASRVVVDETERVSASGPGLERAVEDAESSSDPERGAGELSGDGLSGAAAFGSSDAGPAASGAADSSPADVGPTGSDETGANPTGTNSTDFSAADLGAADLSATGSGVTGSGPVGVSPTASTATDLDTTHAGAAEASPADSRSSQSSAPAPSTARGSSAAPTPARSGPAGVSPEAAGTADVSATDPHSAVGNSTDLNSAAAGPAAFSPAEFPAGPGPAGSDEAASGAPDPSSTGSAAVDFDSTGHGSTGSTPVSSDSAGSGSATGTTEPRVTASDTTGSIAAPAAAESGEDNPDTPTAGGTAAEQPDTDTATLTDGSRGPGSEEDEAADPRSEQLNRDAPAMPSPAGERRPTAPAARRSGKPAGERREPEEKPRRRKVATADLSPIELMHRRDSRRRRITVATLAAGTLLIGAAALPATRSLVTGQLDPAPSPAAPKSAGSAPPPVRAPLPAPPDGVTNGLALWWAADEGTGRTSGDGSGNANQAALSPAAGWEPAGRGGKGSALRFSASASDSFVAGARAAVRTDRSFTVMAWAYITDRRDNRAVLSQPGVLSSAFIIRYDRAGDAWHVLLPRTDATGPDLDIATSTSTPKLRTWTHLAVTFDAASGRATLYVDGRAEDSVRHTARWQATGAIQAGRARVDGAWIDPFGGAIDDLRAYNRPLTAAEVAAIAG